MISTFIPSKDRACQLHLLLESIDRNWFLDDLSIVVLYKASNYDFSKGYEKIRKRFPSIRWVPEGNFSQQFKTFLNISHGEFVGIFTDDCIMYKPVEYTINHILNEHVTEDVFCFSLRLGLNTLQQYYVTKSQQDDLSKMGYSSYFDDNEDYFIKWNWKIRPSFNNYGYPFSLDGCFYRADDLYNLCIDYDFSNPRALESNLIERRTYIQKRNMLSLNEGKIVVNTINVTQNPPIPAGIFHPFGLDKLNEKYLSGQIIDYNKLDFSGVLGCHDELPIQFVEENK